MSDINRSKDNDEMGSSNISKIEDSDEMGSYETDSNISGTEDNNKIENDEILNTGLIRIINTLQKKIETKNDREINITNIQFVTSQIKILMNEFMEKTNSNKASYSENEKRKIFFNLLSKKTEIYKKKNNA